MKKRLSWAIVILLLCGAATYVKSVVNAFALEKGFPTVFSRSLDESKSDGVFVSEVDISQDSGGSSAKGFEVIEAWIERESALEFPLIWLERRVPREASRLIIRTDSTEFHRSFFILPDAKVGFTMTGPNINHTHLQEIPKDGFKIYLSEGWNRPPIQIFSITIKET